MSVNLASRIESAISFGVRWRLAPSTSAIMRSRKVSPGLTVMRTTSQSESTRVPPVTDERSPPDSRTTGRRFAGDRALVHRRGALDRPRRRPGSGRRPRRRRCRPCAASEPGTMVQDCVASRGSGELLRHHVAARAAQRRGLRLAAALGDALGEVGEQQREPEPERDREHETAECVADPEIHSSVTSSAPTSTTNITGFFHCTRGSSLTNDSQHGARAGSARSGS